MTFYVIQYINTYDSCFILPCCGQELVDHIHSYRMTLQELSQYSFYGFGQVNVKTSNKTTIQSTMESHIYFMVYSVCMSIGNLYITNVIPQDQQDNQFYKCNARNAEMDIDIGGSYFRVSIEGNLSMCHRDWCNPSHKIDTKSLIKRQTWK